MINQGLRKTALHLSTLFMLFVFSGCSSDSGGIFIPPDDNNPGGGSATGVSVQFSPLSKGLSGPALDVKGLLSVNPLFAATKGGVMKSADKGASWQRVLNEPEVKVVVVDPQNPQVLYAGGKTGLFKSIDQGTSWTPKSTGIGLDSEGTKEIKEGALLVHPGDSNTLYAGTKNGLYKSSDMAENWTLIEQDLFPTNPNGDHEVKSLAIDPLNPAILYAGTRDGLFKTLNDGTDWAQSDNGIGADNEGLKESKSLVIDPTNTATLYVGTKGGVFKTTDGGANWAAASEGILADDKNNKDIRALALDEKNKRVYAATKMGIFATTDGGTSWGAVNKGLANTDARTVILDAKDLTLLYVGTKGGIFKGAVTAGTATGDTTAPSKTFDLSATPGSQSGTIVLDWTALGDDGNVETVTRYAVHFALSEITDANFDSATQATILPVPVEEGVFKSTTGAE